MLISAFNSFKEKKIIPHTLIWQMTVRNWLDLCNQFWRQGNIVRRKAFHITVLLQSSGKGLKGQMTLVRRLLKRLTWHLQMIKKESSRVKKTMQLIVLVPRWLQDEKVAEREKERKTLRPTVCSSRLHEQKFFVWKNLFTLLVCRFMLS